MKKFLYSISLCVEIYRPIRDAWLGFGEWLGSFFAYRYNGLKKIKKYVSLTIVLTLAAFVLYGTESLFYGAVRSDEKDSLIASTKNDVLISFAGDIMLSRDVGMVIDKYGLDYPYAFVKDIFAGSDIVVANLECPLTDNDRPVLKDNQILFKASADNAKALRDAGIDILSLANNHTMDYHAKGLADTMAALTAAGVKYIGASADGTSAEPVFASINGIKFGFLGFTCLPPEGFYHAAGEASVMYARDGHMDDILRQISETSMVCDFLTVYYHWGDEYTRAVTESQRNIARSSIDAGAKLVVGAHPHVLQESEEYNNGMIYYSLGNFVFDRQNPPNTDKTIILQVTINENIIADYKEIPVRIVNGRPVPEDSFNLR